jgi:hypothetical protein
MSRMELLRRRVSPTFGRLGVRLRSTRTQQVFDKAEPRAKVAKTVLEMLVGVVVVCGVLARAATDLVRLKAPDDAVIFHIVAGGLAVVAAIELAYTLFTPGPDEVIDPLLLGLSSALLFQISKMKSFDWSSGLAAVLFVAAIGGLFAIRRRYIDGAPTRSDVDSIGAAASTVEEKSPEVPTQTTPVGVGESRL